MFRDLRVALVSHLTIESTFVYFRKTDGARTIYQPSIRDPLQEQKKKMGTVRVWTSVGSLVEICFENWKTPCGIFRSTGFTLDEDVAPEAVELCDRSLEIKEDLLK